MKRVIIFLISIQFSLCIFAQDRIDYLITFDHVALSVQDVDKSATFYQNVLNLSEITNKSKTDGIRWFSLGEKKELHLISTIHDSIVLNKAVHFAVSISEFDLFIQNLKATNITFSDWSGNLNKVTVRADGIKQVYIQDPDGYWIEINSVKQNVD